MMVTIIICIIMEKLKNLIEILIDMWPLVTLFVILVILMLWEEWDEQRKKRKQKEINEKNLHNDVIKLQ